MKLNVSMQGLDVVMKDFSIAGKMAQDKADRVTETYTRKMANESADMSPVDSGDLRASIVASPHRLKLGTWEYGSNLPYARRQEYENKSRKGFIRKAVWGNREAYREALKREVTKK